MNITVKKGVSFTIGLDWTDCTASNKKSIIADQVRYKRVHGLSLANAIGEMSIGSTTEKAGYSPASILAKTKHSCLCVLEHEGRYWVVSCIDSLPVSDSVVDSLDEAVSAAQDLMGVMGDAEIIGDLSFFQKAFPDTIITPATWADILELADKSVLKTSKINKLVSIVDIKQIAIIALIASFIYWMYFYDDTAVSNNQIPWEETHRNEVNALDMIYRSTIKNDPKAKLHSIMHTVNTYPVNLAGWTVSAINCLEISCNMIWVRPVIDTAGTYSDFLKAITELEKKHGIVSITNFSDDGVKINHTFTVPLDPFTAHIDKTVTKKDFYLKTLSKIQDASKSKVFSWSLGAANMSSRLTPSPTGARLPRIEFSYGQLSLNGQGLANIVKVADILNAHQLSVNELIITMNTTERPTWSIKGNYVYR